MSQRTIEMILFFGALLLAVLATHAYMVSRSDEQKLQAILASQRQVISNADARQKERDTALASTLSEIAEQKNSKQSPQQLADALANILALPQPIHLVPAALDRPLRSSSTSKGMPKGASLTQPAVTRSPQPTALGKSSLNASSSSDSTHDLGHPPTAPKDSPAPTSVGPVQLSASAPSQVLSAMQASPQDACSNSPKCPPEPPAAELPAADLKPLYNYALDCRACQAQLAVAKQNASDDAAKIAALTRERDAAVTASKG